MSPSRFSMKRRLTDLMIEGRSSWMHRPHDGGKVELDASRGSQDSSGPGWQLSGAHATPSCAAAHATLDWQLSGAYPNASTCWRQLGVDQRQRPFRSLFDRNRFCPLVRRCRLCCVVKLGYLLPLNHMLHRLWLCLDVHHLRVHLPWCACGFQRVCMFRCVCGGAR